MIQNHFELEKQVNKIQQDLGEKEAHVQKIYSTTCYICLTLRVPGATHYLYFGRGRGCEGIWWGPLKPPATLRVQDHFLEYVRKFLGGAILEAIEVDEHFSWVIITYRKYGARNFFILSWSEHLLYILNDYFPMERENRELFLSHQGHRPSPLQERFVSRSMAREDLKKLLVESLQLNLQLSVGERKAEAETGKESSTLENIIKIEQQKVGKLGSKKHSASFWERKKQRILEDINRCEQWSKVREILESGEVTLEHCERVTICGIKFHFERGLSEYKKRDVIYQKTKRLREGLAILQQRLNSLDQEKLQAKIQRNDAEILAKMILLPVWYRQDKKKGMPLEAGTIVPTTSVDGEIVIINLGQNIKAAIGKSTAGNDHLRNHWAIKDDLWLHLEGYKSAHAVVKVQGVHDLSLQQLQLLASALAHFSKQNLSLIPLIYTQVKNLKGVKGVPGKVIYKKEKYVQVAFEPQWQEKLGSIT